MTRIGSLAGLTLFNCPFMAMAVLNADLKISAINGKMAAMLGVFEKRAVGCDFVAFLSDMDKINFIKAAKGLKSGQYSKTISLASDYRSESVNVVVSRPDKTDSFIVYFITDKAFDYDAKLNQKFMSGGDEKSDFLCNIIHGVPDAILIHDLSGRIEYCNAKTALLLGMDAEEIIKTAYLEKLSSDDINLEVLGRFFKNAADGTDQTFSWRLKRASDDFILDVEIFMTGIDRNGERVVMSCIKDITDKKQVEDKLIDSERRYRQLVEYSPDGILIHRGGVIKYINHSGAQILGGSEDELFGRPVIDFFMPEDRPRVNDTLKKLYESKESMPVVQGKITRLDGRLAYLEYASIPFMLDDRMAVQVVIRDVTEKKAQDEFIRHMALHDNLTGLPNRSLLTDRISQSIERRKRDNKLSAVIYIDLDGFKPINDTLGHGGGDIALKEVAHRLLNSIRKSDTAARIGGDEFVVLLEGVNDRHEISVIAKRILDYINEELIIDDTVFHIGASMGISVYPDDSLDHVRLLAIADMAMYGVKETGKNRFAFFGDAK